MRYLGTVILGALLVPVQAVAQDPEFSAVSDADLRDPAAEDWPLWHRNYESWSYSPLDEIDASNVDDLQLAWARGMEAGGQAATPLVVDGVMYLSQPGGEVIRALDAATGDLIWEFKRRLPAGSSFVGRTSRNIAIYGDKIYHSTGDAHVIAINAKSGELEWDTQIDDYKKGDTNSSGPIVARNIVAVGQSCMMVTLEGTKAPADCGITALDSETGKILWRRNVITQPGEPGDETWDGVPYSRRMPASAWLAGSYDPEQDLLIWGTGSGRPYPGVLKGTKEGDQLYTNSTLALDPDDGHIVWYFQHHPKDEFDLDHPFERIFVDTPVKPDPESVPWINPDARSEEPRAVITGVPGKTGVVWTLDRKTGEFLWARPTSFQNLYLDVDRHTGRPVENKAIRNVEVGVTTHVCPSSQGGKNWPSAAYSPLTNAFYQPLSNTCMNSTLVEGPKDLVADPFVGGIGGIDIEYVPSPDANGNLGRIEAVSVETGATLWQYNQRAPVMATVTTGGGLVFFGDTNRRFKALDQYTGELVWETILSGPVTGYPISYAVNGRQYVAVAVGGGNVLNPARLTPELQPGSGSNTIFVFVLPEGRNK